jgi:glycosyltransferase involved in cell wall biosynthesis
VEVVCVDDGSTDHSRRLISSYGDRIIPVFKENGGQASAFNSGFAISKGEIVIFLDSDDFLNPEIAQRVVDAFQGHPGISKVQYPLTMTDESGAPMGEVIPPRPLSSGDLRDHVLRYYIYSYPPTSGNAFTSKILHRIFPVPEESYRICADMYLDDLSVLFGPVFSLNEVGGYYRMHGKNQLYSMTLRHFRNREDIAPLRGVIKRMAMGFEYQQRLAKELGLVQRHKRMFPSWYFISLRIISLKLDPENHPFQEDKLVQLASKGIMAAFLEPVDFFYQRILRGVWFIGMLLLPKKYARILVEKLYNPEKRKKTDRLLSIFRQKRG